MSSLNPVPDPEVPAKARTRRWSAAEKARILTEYEGLSKAEKGALLRREGIYSSLIAAWKLQRDQGALQALAKPAGRPPADPTDRENARLKARGGPPRSRPRHRPAGDRCAGKTLRSVGTPRDRQSAQRERADTMIDEAITDLQPLIGTRAACRATGRAQAHHYRRHRQSPAPARPVREPKPQPRALSDTERDTVRALLNSPDFVDKAPATVFHELLDEGVYLASVSSMYRILRAHGEVAERRRQATHPAHVKPELVATGPNRCWSWDITKLHGPAKWSYFHLYVILDIYSRYTVGWLIADRESAALAEQLLADTIAKQGVDRNTLTIHADNGSSMASKPVAFLLADLGVTKSHSRPHTSNDNPYSQAQFRTLKYRPEFPRTFANLSEARTFCQRFFSWYNTEHRHSGIAWHTPYTVHHGYTEQIRAVRAEVLTAAYDRNPERFVRKHPEPADLPSAAWINKPTDG